MLSVHALDCDDDGGDDDDDDDDDDEGFLCTEFEAMKVVRSFIYPLIP